MRCIYGDGKANGWLVMKGVNMVKCVNGQIEYEGNSIMLTADVCTLVLAIRDILCQQCYDPEVKKNMEKAYEASILRALAMPIGQSDEERKKARKNP